GLVAFQDFGLWIADFGLGRVEVRWYGNENHVGCHWLRQCRVWPGQALAEPVAPISTRALCFPPNEINHDVMPQQQNLFDAEPMPWEADNAAQQLVATVVLATGPVGDFDYSIPGELRNERSRESFVEPGRRLRVPMGRGNRLVTAYCVGVATKPTGSRRLKSVAGVVDTVRLLSPAMLRLTRWMADYYLCPWGQVLEAVVPSGVRGQAGTRE